MPMTVNYCNTTACLFNMICLKINYFVFITLLNFDIFFSLHETIRIFCTRWIWQDNTTLLNEWKHMKPPNRKQQDTKPVCFQEKPLPNNSWLRCRRKVGVRSCLQYSAKRKHKFSRSVWAQCCNSYPCNRSQLNELGQWKASLS